MNNENYRHVGRGLIVLLILFVAFLIKSAQAQECYWDEMKDETIVCDSLVITIPGFSTMTTSRKQIQIYTDEYIWLSDEKKEGSNTILALEDAPKF